MKYKIKDLFYVETGVRITEKDVYEHQGNIPCVTSQTLNEGIAWYADEKWLDTFTKNGKKVIVNTPCLTWAKDGDAGTLFYRDYKFYPNDHCGVLIAKDVSVINPLWLLYTQQEHIKEYATNKDGQGMLYNEQMSEIVIDVPSISEQNDIVKVVNQINELITKAKDCLNNIYPLKTNIMNIGQPFKISDLFFLEMGKNITEEQIYSHQGSIPIITAQTKKEGIAWYADESYLKTISSENIINKKCITWSKNGNAGVIFLRDYKFFPTPDCGYMIPKNDNVLCEYVYFVYRNYFKQFSTSQSTQGKLGLEQMSEIIIYIPDIKTQKDVVEIYKSINDLEVGLLKATT